MSNEDRGLATRQVAALKCETRKPTKILAVGTSGEWVATGQAFPPGDDVVFVDIDEVSAELLECRTPDLVISPILARTFDCIDLAVLLHRLGYKGRYRAVVRSLPDPAIIEREIRHLCPKLDFEVVLTD